MADPLLLSLISVIVVSLVSFVGVLTLSIKDVTLKKVLLYFVGFSAGALLGDVFIHMLPEVAEGAGFGLRTSFFVLSGILASFAVEKIIQWRHCHIPTSRAHSHSFAYMNLFGDAVHNFIDGLIIVASYLVSIPVGVATTLAVIFHEIPQEIGDFGVLLHGGFTKRKALLLNFLSALIAVFGALFALIISSYVENSMPFLLSFAAGGFIYIAGSDLIPELHKKFTAKSSVIQMIAIVLGIAVMYGLLFLE